MIKADRFCSTAMVAYYSKQCYLREINMFLFSGTNFQEYAGKKKHISQTAECLFLTLTFVQELHCQSFPGCLMPSNTPCARAHPTSAWVELLNGWFLEVRGFCRCRSRFSSARACIMWDLLKQICCNNFYSFLLG